MKYTPVAVGAAVGAGDALILKSTSLSSHKYAHGIYKFGILALGAAGEMFFGWNQNIDYGMMDAAAALIGQRIPVAFQSGSGGIKAIATYQAQVGTNVGPTAAGAVAAAKSCSACGDAAAAKLAHAHVAPHHAAYKPVVGLNDYHQREQTPTGAG